MSTTPTTPPAPPPSTPREPGRIRSFLGYLFVPRGKPGELVIVGHSTLFYWWPVWAVSFTFAIMTYLTDTHMALVPPHTTLTRVKAADLNKEILDKDVKSETVQVIVSKKGEAFPLIKRGDRDPEYATPYMHRSRGLGLIFMIVLLVVITITNVQLRGLWSVIIIIVLLLGSVIFAQAGWWDAIARNFGLLAIHINMAGYLFFALVLFTLWLLNFVFFDRQVYMIFTPGQLKVRLEIGGGETAYETTGMVFHKQRSDLFRHWILGFGSGDLVISPGQTREVLEMHNVLNVGRRVRAIERMLKEREVVATAAR
jgi:hypothetical protein